MDQFNLPIESIKQEFASFLEDEKGRNHRILFSGPFGSGKTYFLNEFFKGKDDYFPVFISPVNYTVAGNEDIFELIKFDILFHFIEQSSDIERSTIIELIPGLDPVNKLEELLVKSDQTDHNLLAKLNINKFLESEGTYEAVNKLQKFIRKHTQGNGVYERNRLSALLSILLEQISAGKKTVLIIDDLDRVDPEHIFRVLNVFSAHVDIDKNTNKFGFDKIIMVCDVRNIRRVFSARYGQETDFSGYIDKFYSRKIFEFDNSIALEKAIDAFVMSIRILPNERSGFGAGGSLRSSDSYVKLIKYLILVFCKSGHLKLRRFNECWGMSYYRFQKKNLAIELSPVNYYLIDAISLMIYLMGSADSWEVALDTCVVTEISKKINDRMGDPFHLSKMGLILVIFEQYSTIRGEEIDSYTHPSLNIRIPFVSNRQQVTPDQQYFARIKPPSEPYGIEKVEDVFPYLQEAYRVLKSVGIF